ncbi:MAG TPA: hypothetical protein ENJ37_02710 [Deltaproteobacteria bacterium]|nr:hypothetical protein [Deltaproteobacteria bacterium]
MFPWFVERSAQKAGAVEVEGVPWTPLSRPLSESTLAVVTTAGVHLRSQPPFDMDDPDGDPSYRILPAAAPRGELVITHDYYDHSDAERDINIVYPVDRLAELREEGLIGALAENNYGFMGHIDGRHVRTLIDETAPEVARRLKSEGVDVALLTPG